MFLPVHVSSGDSAICQRNFGDFVVRVQHVCHHLVFIVYHQMVSIHQWSVKRFVAGTSALCANNSRFVCRKMPKFITKEHRNDKCSWNVYVPNSAKYQLYYQFVQFSTINFIVSISLQLSSYYGTAKNLSFLYKKVFLLFFILVLFFLCVVIIANFELILLLEWLYGRSRFYWL